MINLITKTNFPLATKECDAKGIYQKVNKKSAKINYYILLSKELNKKWLKSKENILLSELHTKSDKKSAKIPYLLLSELPLKSNQKVYKNLLLLLSKVVNKKLPKSLQKSTICWVT